MERYRIFDRETGDTLEYRPFNPYDPESVYELIDSWPYAAVDWELE